MSPRTIIVCFVLSLTVQAGSLSGNAQAPGLAVAGSWQGVLTAGATQLRLTFDLSRAADGEYLGTVAAQYARWEALDPAFKFADFMRTTVSQAPRATRDLVEQVLRIEAAQQVDGMKPIPDLPLAVITAMYFTIGSSARWSCAAGAARCC